MDLIGQTKVGSLYLPDKKTIKFALNGLSRNGLETENPYLDEHMFKQYEEVESRIRYLKCKPDDMFLDIGACIGSWSMHAAVYGARVYAFEIGKPHISTMLLNSRLNNVQKSVFIHKLALGSKEDIELSFDGWMHVYEKSDNYALTVKSTTLDKWVKEHNLPHIDYIKIDVEGMEYDVLTGALNTIKEYKPKLIIEIHESDCSRKDVENLITDLGYNHEHIFGLNDYFYPNEPKLTDII